MITIPNSEGIIWYLENNIMDIIREYQQTGSAVIDLNGEGPCCEQLGLYRILDRICETFGFDKSKITIVTYNQLEQHDHYQIDIKRNYYQDIDYVPEDIATGLKSDAKHIGLFIGRSNYVRLWFLGWLDPNKSLITSHIDRNDDFHKANIGLDDMIKWGATTKDLHSAINVIEKSPLKMDEIDSYPILVPAHLNLLKIYDQFFTELVCETFFSGQTFYTTEKIFRPILGLKPFIIHASPGYLRELKKLGYLTFDHWWSEEYDNYGEQLRIYKIQEIITEIMSWDQNKLQQVYQEMMPVLEHNRKHYFEQQR